MTELLLTGVVSSLWFGSAAALCLVLLLLAVPAIPARWRYRGWFAVLLLITLLPLSAIRWSDEPAVLVRRVTVVAAAEHSSAPPVPIAPVAPVAPIAPTAPFAPVGDTGAPALPRTLTLSPDLLPLLATLWLAGALIGLVSLVGDLWRLFRVKGRSVAADGVMLDRWLKLGYLRRRSARLLASDDIRLPAACGYLRPAVLLPSAFAELDARQARHLLLHEAAHLDRYDDWLLLAERVLQLLCWWHPVAWIARRQLDATRELACDAAAVESGDRKAYAGTLLALAEMSLPVNEGMAPGALRGVLSARVEALVVHPRKWSLRRAAPAVAAAGLLLWSMATIEPPHLHALRIISDTVIARHEHAGFARGGGAMALDSTFDGFAQAGFSGSVLLAQGDSIILDKGYGLADRDAGIAAMRTTRYSTAGMTKMFTAAAILLLEDSGKLSVTDTLGRWFAALPGDMARVTIHHLLTHTDGLTRLSAPVYRADGDDFIDAVAAAPRAFPAGTSYRYNDFGHSILGLIIEQVTGEEYERYIRRTLLLPAGMTHTSFEPEDAETAIEYSGRAGQLEPIAPRAYTWGRRGSLGMVSTTGDLFRWSRAMRNPQIIPDAVREKMMTTYGRTDWEAEISYGWDRMTRRNGAVLWRRVAGTPGMEGELLYDPTNDWTAVILVNTRLGWRFNVWKELER